MSYEMLWTVLIAAALDTLVFTGFFTSGGAIAAAASAAFLMEITKLEVFLFAFAGAMLGEVANAILAGVSGIKDRLGESVEKIRSGKYRRVLKFLPAVDDRFWLIFLKILILRFVALTRPLGSGVLVVARGVRPADFLAVALAVAVWVGFWVVVFDYLVDVVGGSSS